MSGENVLNRFVTPHSGNDNNLLLGGTVTVESGATLTIASGATATINTLEVTTLNVAAGGKIKADASTGTASSNALTLSKMAGVVTTEALTTAAGASQAITITNTLAATGDIVLVTIVGGTNTRNAIRLGAVAGSGSITVTIYNNEPTNALDGTVIFNFLLVKTQ